jgi:hypothetical protein
MNRKTALILLLLTVQLSQPVWASWEVSPFAGGRLGGSITMENSTYDRLELQNSPVVGLAIGGDVSDEGAVEVLWSHQETTLRGRLTSTGMKEDVTDIASDQFFLNGLYYLQEGPLRPFALAGMGATSMRPYGKYENVTRFAWALGGGVKYYFNKVWGMRADARWVPTAIQSDSSVFCRSDAGAQCIVTSSGTMLDQFELTGGIFVRFGNKP